MLLDETLATEKADAKGALLKSLTTINLINAVLPLNRITDASREQLYRTRNRLVIGAVYAAQAAGQQAGFRIDPQEPEWPVAFIELPTGQVSWHLPQHEVAWDGHSAEEKYARIAAFLAEEETE